MRIISNADVAKLLPMDKALAVVEQALCAVSSRQTEMLLRHVIPVGGRNMMGVMSGAMLDPASYGVKLVSLFPDNPAKGLSGHRGAIVLFEAETGGAVAMMDAGLLTAIRTAAASGVATRALARPDVKRLVIIGTGEQAEHHITAMLSVRCFSHVQIIGRRLERAKLLAEAAAARYPEIEFTFGTDAQSAVGQADVVCTLTNSAVPVLQGAWLHKGQHLNIVGASIPSKREVDDEVIRRSKLWVDYRPSALAQAGELVDMIGAGQFDPQSIQGEIGEVLQGSGPARQSDADITAYRSLGVIAQDLAAARFVWQTAVDQNIGTEVEF